MNDFINGLKFSLSYFSIIPISFKDNVDLSKKDILGFMIILLPFVGLIIGLLTLISFYIFQSNIYLAAIISSVLYMILYGFIHTEAVIDVVDAIYAKHAGKDAYKVIKESTVGAMGILYTFALVIIKITTMSFLFINQLFIEFLSILIISRFYVVFTVAFYEFKSSFIRQLKESISLNVFLIFTIFYMIFIYIGTSFSFLIFILFSSFLLTIFIVHLLKRKLGFINGDVLGTLLELLEVILFITVCYIWL